MILIKNGRVIDPKRGVDDVLDIIIDGNKVKKIGKYQRTEEYDRIIEARGMVVAPGFVDVHVHFRDPGQIEKEDIQTGARAAAKGGFTTVVCMANTKPSVDNIETLEYVIKEGKKAPIHVLATANVTVGMQGKELTDMELLKAHGAAGFTDDGIALMDEVLLKRAMEEATRLNLPISLHEENKSFVVENGVNHGEVSAQLGIFGSPALAEDCIVARDCMIALHTNAVVNIQHISSRNSVHMVRLAKALGAKVVAEVTPHHFSLDEEAVLKKGTLAKMNPPLRTRLDRYELIEGLKDGTIDIIATDHAPHTTEEKNRPLTEAPSGILGLETALALAVTKLVRKGHMTLIQLMEKMSLNPSLLYDLNKGTIEEGAEADIVIFSESESWTVAEFESKSCNSPFIGETLYGKVKYTICSGAVVYEDAKLE